MRKFVSQCRQRLVLQLMRTVLLGAPSADQSATSMAAFSVASTAVFASFLSAFTAASCAGYNAVHFSDAPTVPPPPPAP